MLAHLALPATVNPPRVQIFRKTPPASLPPCAGVRPPRLRPPSVETGPQARFQATQGIPGELILGVARVRACRAAQKPAGEFSTPPCGPPRFFRRSPNRQMHKVFGAAGRRGRRDAPGDSPRRIHTIHRVLHRPVPGKLQSPLPVACRACTYARRGGAPSLEAQDVGRIRKRKHARTTNPFDPAPYPQYFHIEGRDRPVRHRHPLRRNEVHKPQEGRRSLRRTPRAFAVKTPKGRPRQAACPPTTAKPTGGGAREERGRRGGGRPLEGEKPKGGTSRPGASAPMRPRTSAEMKPREASEDTAESSAAGPLEPTSGGEDRTERRGPCRGRGNLRRAQSQERTDLKHGREVAGGRKRQEGRNPGDAAYPGEANPGKSLPASASAVGKQTLERRASPRGGARPGSVKLRRRAEVQERLATTFSR